MERRRHPRYPVNLEVTVIELSARGASSQATLTDISASGVRIVLDHPLAPGEAIRMDIIDSLFWGRVVHLRTDGAGFSIGVEIEKVLIGGSDLSMLLKRLLEKPAHGVPDVLELSDR